MQKIGNKLFLSATDLANHVACQHLTSLNWRAANGEIKRPFRNDSVLETLIERGRLHEKAYVDYLCVQGKKVADLSAFKGEQAIQETLTALNSGIDVIVQGALGDDRWYGRPDLLIRADVPSHLGTWSYDVADTKLTQNTKAGTILQLCMYSDLLGKVQRRLPEKMDVVIPGSPFEIDEYRLASYLAYYRRVKRGLEQWVDRPFIDNTYPQPVSHCDVCGWWSACDTRRRADDHLSFVAGIQKRQIVELNRQQVETLEDFALAEKPLSEPPEHGSHAAFERVHNQAKIQHRCRVTGKPEYEFLTPVLDRGFFKLPEPNAGDVFFDIEGDPHVPQGGIEYLFGFVARNVAGDWDYTAYWALNRREERAAFERFIDAIMQRWAQFPGMHIYHYAPYEPSAMKRLAMRYSTREDEVDRLLRAKRFIDLYAVVRQGLRAGVESYSIKSLEAYFDYKREVSLENARHSMCRMERALELGLCSEIGNQDKKTVEGYNKDDCISALQLRAWLEQLRQELVERGHPIARPELLDGTASELVQEQSTEVQKLFEQLVGGIPDANRTSDQAARWLLAHLLDYFRREDKCVWWEYFRLRDLEPDELLLERRAITGLQFECAVPGGARDRNPTHRYRFPEQDVQVRVGESLHQANQDSPIGTVANIELGARTLNIKKTAAAANLHPGEVFAFDRINPKQMPDSLHDFARTILQFPIGSAPKSARYDLLAKARPRLKTLKLPLSLEPKDAAVALALDLDNSILPIQGPPGSGKTFIASHTIAELAKNGKRLGVTAVGHKVIANLLSEVQDRGINVAHRNPPWSEDESNGIQIIGSPEEVVAALNEGTVVGATAWLWANNALDQQLDYLFIDEAGQMSLAMALAAGRAAKNIVLLGDPQQLEQPQQGSHPEGADVAALHHLLDGHDTIPDDRGLFIPNTWRLHPSICEFTSEQYYEGRLASRPEMECQAIVGSAIFPANGLAFLPVIHEGNQNQCVEEAQAICWVLAKLLDGTHQWRNDKNQLAPLTSDDILIVAPYNAQVGLLQGLLPKGARIGTVDKFQGQEAAVVIYSATSSSVQDAPRGLGFLYSPNRLNVATSRARCLAILIASPTVLHAECATPEHIRLVNGFCRFVEMATSLSSHCADENMKSQIRSGESPFR